MNPETATAKIEKLAESLVLLDGSQGKVFVPLQDDFTELAIWARQQNNDEAVEACARAINLITATAENQISPESAHESLCGIVGQLQHAFCHGLESTGMFSRLAEFDAETHPTPLSSLADERILGEFLARQELVIDELEGLLLSIERNADGEALHRCRRLIHTLKGESSLLGMAHVERICHAMEDALTANRINALFEAKDWLSASFQLYAGKEAKVVRTQILVAKLQGREDDGFALNFTGATSTASEAAAESDVFAFGMESAPSAPESDLDIPENVVNLDIQPGTDISLLADFLNESSEHLEAVDVSLMDLEGDPSDKNALNAVFRAFHTIKGLAGFLNLQAVRMLAHESENLLDKLRSGEMLLNPKRTEILFSAVDGMRRLIGLLDPSAQGGPGVPLRELVCKVRATAAGQVPAAAGVAPTPPSATKVSAKAPAPAAASQAVSAPAPPAKAPASPKPATPAQSTPSHPTPAMTSGSPSAPITPPAALQEKNEQAATPTQVLQVRETVKIESDRLDRLLDTIGELVIAEAMIVQSPELRGQVSAIMTQRLAHLDKITRNLQELGTSLRMVPIRPVFQKMARLVRDLSHKCGKPVEFTMVGEHTELDKAVVDRIADPLVHMVRNAVDHGVEPDVNDRIAAGKSATANLRLSAYQKGGNICIDLEDDGRGLNREAILRKARERGLLQGDGAGLEDREVWAFIFEPGFSTAAQVTEVSGRGVGMDVVKRTFEELRGRIEIQSTLGKGTRFTVWLPLTMAIIDGMVVRVGGERCIFPTLSVTTVLPYREEDGTTVLGKGHLLNFQGRQVPVFFLDAFLGSRDPKSTDSSKRLAVIAETGGRTVGFIVDDLLGKQQIVIKSLGATFRDIDGLAGAAILPDGHVGLIFDVDGLCKALTESKTPELAATALQA